LDAQGRTILPGLTDSHIHLSLFAQSLAKINCETATKKACLELVANKARTAKAGEWITGHGWNQNNWPEGFGTAADLDAVSPDNPVYLTDKALHAAWANTAAMRLAGISSQTTDPRGGIIQRTVDGSPTGIFFETAVFIVERAIPKIPAEMLVGLLKHAQQELWKVGLTAVHDFDDLACFEALQTLHQKGELKLRVTKSIPEAALDDAVAMRLQTGFGDAMLRIGSLKLFADGALGPQTAAMLDAYTDNPDNFGVLIGDSQHFYPIFEKAVRNHLAVAVHAIGDRANREVLNAYTRLRIFETQNHLPKFPHRIEHVQIIQPQDQACLVELGITASMQPIHATSDMFTCDRCWGDRSRYAYAFKELLNRGAHLVFGSDAPVESPNPFFGLHAAVTRKRQDGSPNQDGWYPAQKLSLSEALKAYTSGPSAIYGRQAEQGSLIPGSFADLILLDSDPFQVNMDDLHFLKPSGTMIAGEWVWKP
jgi:predicted amidohydrolase YtcJ